MQSPLVNVLPEWMVARKTPQGALIAASDVFFFFASVRTLFSANNFHSTPSVLSYKRAKHYYKVFCLCGFAEAPIKGLLVLLHTVYAICALGKLHRHADVPSRRRHAGGDYRLASHPNLYEELPSACLVRMQKELRWKQVRKENKANMMKWHEKEEGKPSFKCVMFKLNAGANHMY